MQKIKLFPLLFLAALLGGCFSSTASYEGICYPQTKDCYFTFLEESVPPECTAFSHVLMSSKAKSTGKDIADAMFQEAEGKGADLVLIGMARTLTDDDLDENEFDYYGPNYAYTFQKTWLGWKFGFDKWDDADAMSPLGVDSWGNENITFDNSLIIQAVFLRCGTKE